MKEKKTVIGLLLGAVMLMAVGYAAFATNLVINGTANIESNWKVLFTDIDIVSKSDGVTIKNTATASGTTATFDVGLTSPGDKIEYRITVANQGSIDAVIESINASDTGSDAIIFEITNIKTGDILLKNSTTTFNVKISYKDSITSQPNILINKLTVNINYVQNVGQSITQTSPVIGSKILMARILNDNNAQSDANIDFSKTSSETNTNGLYYTNENTEDNKTTYYFRGAVENNYVKFGKTTHTNACIYNGKLVMKGTFNTNGYKIETITDEDTCTKVNVCYVDDVGHQSSSEYFITNSEDECLWAFFGTVLNEKATFYSNYESDILWRIVRINEDGSIRLVKQDSIGYYSYRYIEYMDENKNNSDMKDALDTWYTKYLNSYSNLFSKNAGFCNDRSVVEGLGNGSTTYYGAYQRFVNQSTGSTARDDAQPQFKCPNESNDLFTLTTSTKGNKALINPIGMLSLDEVIYAGGMIGNNQSYYLYNGEHWMTMSPVITNSPLTVGRNGDLGFAVGPYPGGHAGVRPVINLVSNVEILDNGANGTLTNPYVIKTN